MNLKKEIKGKKWLVEMAELCIAGNLENSNETTENCNDGFRTFISLAHSP